VKVDALEADSQKNTAIKAAEAQAQAKPLDSEAEEYKVRKLAGANAEKMRLEADVLRGGGMLQNPMFQQPRQQQP
jgi:regulator of protease activity HflC (stomatin/prohibitin superfamily)